MTPQHLPASVELVARRWLPEKCDSWRRSTWQLAEEEEAFQWKTSECYEVPREEPHLETPRFRNLPQAPICTETVRSSHRFAQQGLRH